jgi:hypothetical protein
MLQLQCDIVRIRYRVPAPATLSAYGTVSQRPAAKLVLMISGRSVGSIQQHAHCSGLPGPPDVSIPANDRCLRIRPVDVSPNCMHLAAV